MQMPATRSKRLTRPARVFARRGRRLADCLDRAGSTAIARQGQVLAPTAHAFMMDWDTTGIEPDIALVKYSNWPAAE